MPAFTELNQKIAALGQAGGEAALSAADALVRELVGMLGVRDAGMSTLLTLPRIQSEVARFVNAPGFRKQAAAYEIPHASDLPIDLKLFWLHKASKTNLSWVVGVTSNYEDSPENFSTRNIGIDFVLPESADRLFVILSSNLKLRVLELHGNLTHTQREIFTQWLELGALDLGAPDAKKNLHARLWKSFDHEPTNREFYKVLVEHFDLLTEHLAKTGLAGEDTKLFAVRLIGRLLFLWFLRKKDFLDQAQDYFSVASEEDQTAYYRARLEPLFFDVLNTELKKREVADRTTPFLNGGLFEPIEVDHYHDTQLTFPNGFFANLYTKLNHYNFTVDEGTSEYEHVAIDPEMLGRVFENLLASLNDETGTQARKAKGAFYTPREIVDYMCAESLIAYLRDSLPETPLRDERVRELVTLPESTFRDQDHNKRRDFERDLGKEKVKESLDTLRVLDPAVGSGAFPMGMLHLLVKVYGRLDTRLEKDPAKLKRQILSRTLYGVDIDQMAIQISRLRAWLSILVDMEEMQKIDPLPNLDFKFVCANTLIPLDESQQDTLADTHELKEKLLAIRDQYYEARRKDEKEKLRREYETLIRDGGLLKALQSRREQHLKEYHPFNPLTSASFYDPDLMHGVPTFDIVIGNPPYVSTEKIKGELKDAYQAHYAAVHASRTDLYAYFYARGLELTKEGGLVCYITSNKWMRAGYGEPLRAYFLTRDPLLLIDLGSGIFESATVDTNILLVRNSVGTSALHAVTLDKRASASLEEFVADNATRLGNLSDAPWAVLSSAEQTIKEKIEHVGRPLGKWTGVRISFGIKTGLNEAFIVDEATYNRLVTEDPRSAEILKPVLAGRDIRRYGYANSGLYIILAKFGSYKILEKEYPAVYAHLAQYEDALKARGQCRGTRSGKAMSPDYSGQHHWLELDNNPNDEYIAEVRKEKIAWREITSTPSFRIVPEGIFIYAPATFISLPTTQIRYVLAILNSKLVLWFFATLAHNLGTSGIEWKKMNIERIPIPSVEMPAQRIIENLVDEIMRKKLHASEADTSALEARIDDLVFDLYGLTPEERAIVLG